MTAANSHMMSSDSPRAYHQSAGPYNQQSRQVPQPHGDVHPHQFSPQLMTNPFPNTMAPLHSGQFYPGPNPSFAPVYGQPDHQGYSYYYPPGAWPVPQPMVYHGYANVSPPSTPPNAQMQYGYQIGPNGEYFVGGPAFPPSPPNMTSFIGPQLTIGHAAISPLEVRRGSWSSVETPETPVTPFVRSARTERGPVIVGDINSYAADHAPVKANLESLLENGPPLPAPVYSPEGVKTIEEALDNPTNTTNVYIRGLPPDTDDEKLFEMTRRFGVVISHKAIMEIDNGTCKGYGFARYETKQQSENCIRAFVGLKYEAGFARESFNARLKTLADPSSTNVYVSNLSHGMNEKDMQDIFVGYNVISNRILRDNSGASRGVGFARFEDRDTCDEIIKKFHGMIIGEEKLALQVRYADTNAQKRLKATTTKKRQFRSHEYNTVLNGRYSSMSENSSPQPIHHRNRVWHRQNSSASNMAPEASASPQPQDSPIPADKGWEKSQEWKRGEENRPADWKPVSWRANVNGSEKKLESVPEDDLSDCNSVVTTVPTVLDYGTTGKASSNKSFSDPGDSYGGRELCAKSDL